MQRHTTEDVNIRLFPSAGLLSCGCVSSGFRDDSPQKGDFMQNMIEDRTESALSYYEFLLHMQQQISK